MWVGLKRIDFYLWIGGAAVQTKNPGMRAGVNYRMFRVMNDLVRRSVLSALKNLRRHALVRVIAKGECPLFNNRLHNTDLCYINW